LSGKNIVCRSPSGPSRSGTRSPKVSLATGATRCMPGFCRDLSSVWVRPSRARLQDVRENVHSSPQNVPTKTAAIKAVWARGARPTSVNETVTESEFEPTMRSITHTNQPAAFTPSERYWLPLVPVLTACLGKLRWDEIAARAAAVAMTLKYREVFEAYPCPHCQSWHIGHAHRRVKGRAA